MKSGNDEAKRLILARRARFLAAALATVTSAGAVAAATEACSGGVDQTSTDGGSSGDGADPQPCLSPQQPQDGAADGNPQPCLSVATDSGPGKDADPQPCLTPPIDDGG